MENLKRRNKPAGNVVGENGGESGTKKIWTRGKTKKVSRFWLRRRGNNAASDCRSDEGMGVFLNACILFYLE